VTGNIAFKIKLILTPLGFVARLLSPGKEQKIRLVREGKLADDAHEPVLYILQKQNRELSYARSEGTNRSYQTKLCKWRGPGKWTKIISHRKVCKRFEPGILKLTDYPYHTKIL